MEQKLPLPLQPHDWGLENVADRSPDPVVVLCAGAQGFLPPSFNPCPEGAAD